MSDSRIPRWRERIVIHAALLAGCVVFSLPFFWLVTTSFKADKEMFVQPPEWIPELPRKVTTSPYLYTWRGDTTTQFFGLGVVTMQDLALSDHPVPNSTTAWRVVGSSSLPTTADSLEARPVLRVPYDFRATDRLVIEGVFPAPVPIDQLRRIEVTYKSDLSFHHIKAEIITRAGTWRSHDAAVLNTATWKSAPWQFTRPRQEERDALRLTKVSSPDKRRAGFLVSSAGAAPAGILPADDVLVRLTLERSSWPRAIWRKYVDNYVEALSYIPFGRFVVNTAILTALNIVFQLLSCSLVAYGFARIRWPGRNIVFALLLATMMIPGQVVMIPQFLIWRGLHLYNTWGPLFLGALFGSGFFIFLLRQFMLAIPTDLEDAAKIDGAGYLTVWRQIMLPLVKPALAAIAIFQFMGTWNDFFGPLIYINSKGLMPISLGLYMFRDAHGAEYGMLMAASLMMVTPVILLFFFAQRYFIQGVTLTGLKG